MNTEYLNALPEIENKFGFNLMEDEKVVYNTELSVFGDEKGENLCYMGKAPEFAITNKRMLLRSGPALWTTEIEEEVASCRMEESKFLFWKSRYFSVTLKQAMVYDQGPHKRSLIGFRYFLKKGEEQKFEELMHPLFS